jgi:hypothetical protein
MSTTIFYPNEVMQQLLIEAATETPLPEGEFYTIINSKYIASGLPPVLKARGNAIAHPGGFCMLIAPQGTGKSNVCEAIVAAFVNPLCDALGFEIELSEGKKILYLDTERTKDDVKRGYDRIIRRSDMDMIDIENLTMISLIDSFSAKQSMGLLEEFMDKGEYGFLIIDGVADMINTVNDEEEARYFWRRIVSMLNRHACAGFMTIHPNPAEQQGKATGHLGTIGARKAESVLNAHKADGARVISSNYSQGKVRNAKDDIEISFVWSDEEKMFVSSGAIKKSELWQNIFESIEKISQIDLEREIMNRTGKSLKWAQDRIKEWKRFEYIEMKNILGNSVWVLRGASVEENKDENDLPF